MIAELIPQFGFEAKVFFKGDFCGTNSFDGNENVGHLHFIRQGTVMVENEDDEELLLIEGPAVLLYPRPCKHRLVVPADVKAKLVCAELTFRDVENNPFLAAMPKWLHIPVDEASGLGHTTEHLFLEAYKEEPGQRYVLERLSDILVFEIIRYVFKHENLPAGTLAGFTDPGIARSLAAIHDNPGTGWTITTMAQKASMSRSKFALRFHALVGTTPARYLSNWRMSVAKKMLQQGCSVKSVASAVGYSNQPSFTTAFINSIGVAPRQWVLRNRQQHAGNSAAGMAAGKP